MVESCAGNVAKSQIGAGIKYVRLDDRATCQRSPMNGKGEEEEPTTTMETMSLELVLRNPLIGEGVSGDASARTRNAYNLRLAPFFPLWIFNCNLEPKFLLHFSFFLLFYACMIR